MRIRPQSPFLYAWVAFGLLMVAALALCYLIEENQVPSLRLAAWFLVWLAWIPLHRVVSGIVARHPIERRRWRARLPEYLLTGVAMIASLLILRVLLETLFHWLADSPVLGFELRAFHVQSVVYDLFVYSGFIALRHAASYHRQYTERRVRSAELEAQMAEIELSFLKAQLQPHFLLNSLNLISAQIYEDIEKADAMIADLGGLLRATLESPKEHEISLRRELELLELYLDIARARFGTRLRVVQSVDPKSHGALVPTLLLQPLVENAIRYGIAGAGQVSRVAVTAKRDPYYLLLTVSDNGPGLPEPGVGRSSGGIGLDNTRRRLEQLYGSDFKFSLDDGVEGGAVVTVEIPFRPGSVQQLLERRDSLRDHSHPDHRRRTRSA